MGIRMRRTRSWLYCASVFVSLFSTLTVAGQSNPSKDPDPKALVYEVVSVRPSKQGDGMSVSTEPNRLVMGGTTLLGMLFNAFPIRPHDDIPGMPSWGTTALFDVEAKMDEGLAAQLQKLPKDDRWEKRQLMLQALLADRFKMRFHFESRERPIYSLQIAKGGFKCKIVAEKDADRGSSWSADHVEVRGGTTTNLAYSLSDTVGRQVRDDTGLRGKYYMLLKWTPEEKQNEGEVGPTIFTAMQEQLGLKLVSAKGQVETLVIDHVEKPSEN
jgi:uncharacterized protein (TIGR03435 family)